MINKLLPVFSLALLCLILHEQNLSYFSYKASSKSEKRGSEAVYEALVTGDKTGVSKKTIKTMKEFGLMHLLTPSGLHLGSFLLLFKFFPRMKFLITLALFLCSFWIPGFLALKRMLVFYLVNFWLKNIKLSFLATAVLSIIFGNFAESPISFCFTFLFWGCIVFHNGSKFGLAKNLFLFQAAVACLFHQNINLSALFVNPLVTFGFSLIFPLLLFFYPVEMLKPLGLYVIEGFTGMIDLLERLSWLNVAGEMAILLMFFLAWRNKFAAPALALLMSSSLDMDKKNRRKIQNVYHPLPVKAELLKEKGRKAEFIDRTCWYNLSGDVSCKKKPSHLGGPAI